MTFAKILCPIDFSPGARQAMQIAIRIAKAQGAELVLFHSSYIPAAAVSLEAPFPPYLIQDLTDEAQRGLDAAVREAMDSGATKTTSRLASGVPWSEIVEHLRAQSFDLCVIGTHGRTGLSRVLLGSVAETVIRHAPCSVMAVRPDSDIGEFKHALVPTDFSESAMAALALASELAPAITLLHVLELPVSFAGEIATDFATDLDKGASNALDAAAALHSASRIEKLSRIGYPGSQTLSALDHDASIDLVVMGTHGRTGIKRLLLGSVAEKVVRHARCPVLVARPRS